MDLAGLPSTLSAFSNLRLRPCGAPAGISHSTCGSTCRAARGAICCAAARGAARDAACSTACDAAGGATRDAACGATCGAASDWVVV